MALMLSALPLLSFATDIDVADANGNVLRYSYSGTGAATVTQLVSVSDDATKAGHLVIPATITDGDQVAHSVTGIYNSAFNGNTNVLSVEVGANVTSIGDYAFQSCTSLTTVTGGASVTTLGDYSFANTRLTEAFLPDAVTTIGYHAFQNIPTLKTIVLGPHVSGLSRGSFVDYSETTVNVERIVLNGTYNTIPSSFAIYFKKLKEVTIGSNVTVIDAGAFKDLDSLTTLTLPAGLLTIGSSAFEDCDQLASITIPDQVTSVGNSAFLGCDLLASADIGSSVTSLGDNAFRNCTSLTTVTGGEIVTSLGDYCFANTRLTEAFLPNAVTTIGSHAFQNIPTLKAIVLGPNVSGLSRSSFVDYNESTVNVERIVFNGTYAKIPDSFTNYFKKLREVTIGSNVTEIGSNAFKDLDSLISVTLPASLLTIGSSAFEDCDQLTSIIIPDQVTSVGNSAFLGCDLLASADIGSSVTSLGNNAFQNCASLTTVTGGESVTTLGSSCFASTRLTKAFLPNAVRTIGTYAFQNIPTLTTIEFGPNVSSISRSIFIYNYYESTVNVERIVFNGTYAKIPDNFTNYFKKLRDVTIGSNVTEIGSNAFQDLDSLTSITLPAGLLTIGSYAFDDCDQLASIIIPDQVTSVGNYAFHSCDLLASAYIGSGMTAIGTGIFQDCWSLTTVTGGENVTSLGSSCFANTRLTTAFIPNGVTTIGSYAFQNIPTLKTIEFGPNVSSINRSSFIYNYYESTVNVERIVFNGTYAKIPDNFTNYFKKLKDVTIGANVTEIGNSAFNDLDSLTAIVLPDGITTIGSSAFDGCDNLASVTFGTGLTTIDNYAFRNCFALTSADLRGSVQTIGQYAFENCAALTSLTGLESLVTMGSYAVSRCTSLTELTLGTAFTTWNAQSSYSYSSLMTGMRYLTLPGTTNPFKSSSSPYGLPKGMLIYVPESMLETYRSTSYLSEYRFMAIGSTQSFAVTTTAGGQLQEQVEAVADKAEDVLELIVTGPINGTDIEYMHRYLTNIEVLDLSGAQIVTGGESYHRWDHAGNTSTMYGNSSYNTETDKAGNFMFANLTGLRTLVLPNGLTTIGAYTFADCRNLTSLTIPDGVTEIGNYAFSYERSSDYVNKLATLHLPANLTSLGENAFYNQKSLQRIEIPAGVTEVKQNTFMYCSVKEVTLNEGLQSIGFRAFYDSGLETINLPSTLTSMGNETFYSTELKGTIALPGALTALPNHAFYSCERLTGVSFSEGLQSIGNNTFQNCKQLTEVSLPQSLKTIGNNAFINCYRMRSVALPTALESIGSSAFEDCDSMYSFTFPETILTVPNSVLRDCDLLTTVQMASGTRKVDQYAFSGCKRLTGIDFSAYTRLTQIMEYSFQYTGLTNADLPNWVDTLFYGAFQNCDSLRRATIPTGVDYVASNLFYNCKKLASVTMHDGINRVNSSAFESCVALPTIDLNDGITTIGDYAFRYCAALELPGNKLPTALTTIGNYAFNGCTKVSITAFPTGLQSIGHGGFKDCKALMQATLPASIKTLGNEVFAYSGVRTANLPTGTTSFGTEMFRECDSLLTANWPTDRLKVPNYTFYGCDTLQNIALPDAVTEIGNYAFYNCRLLPTTFHWPTSLTRIDNSAFENDTCLTEITLPISLRLIDDHAFRNTHLRHIEIPDSVTTLGDYVFYNCDSLRSATLGRSMNYGTNSYFNYFYYCDNLETLRIYAGTPPTLSNNNYINAYYKKCELQVPMGVDSLYREATHWKDFKLITTFLTGDKLAPEDYAILKRIYQLWDGENWTHTWDLSTDDRFVGKWYGITFDGDHIATLNLRNNNLSGPLTRDVFDLPALTELDLSRNALTAQLDTVLSASVSAPGAAATLTSVNLSRNYLEGDLAPFANKLPNLTYFNLAYNLLTAISEPISKDKLSNGNGFWYSYQFCDWHTGLPYVSEKYPVREVYYGEPITIEWNTLQNYNHSSQNYSRTHSYLMRCYKYYSDPDYDWSYDGTDLYVLRDGVYVVPTNQDVNPRRDEVTALVSSGSSSLMTPIIVKFHWHDGDVNADQTVDVTDLQGVVNYALTASRLSDKTFNFTAADAITDKTIDVRDVVATVNSILAFDEDEPSAGVRAYIGHYTCARNVVAIESDALRMANADDVAAIQFTLVGQNADDLMLAPELRGFSLSKRQVGDNTRVVIYNANGRTIAEGEHTLLLGVNPQAVILDPRLTDAEANYLEAGVHDIATDIAVLDGFSVESSPSEGDAIYTIDGRRIPSLKNAPSGVYVIKRGNKQWKVRK